MRLQYTDKYGKSILFRNFVRKKAVYESGIFKQKKQSIQECFMPAKKFSAQFCSCTEKSHAG